MAANRTSQLHEASIQATWLLQRLGRELRLARYAAGLPQAAVGQRVGLSDSEISRIERGQAPGLTVAALHRHAALVGLRVWIRLYPGGRRVLDAPQIALMDALRARLRGSWTWQLEVPVAIEGDLRAADAVLSRGDVTIAVEAITRLSDVQAQVRAAQLKRRDIGATQLILLVGGSRANRAALRDAAPLVSAAFLTGTRKLVQTLADGRDPGGDCLLVL
jgi:transcriptional regulator with XRE-family HTH domain